METIKGKIRDFILTHVLPGESPANLKDDTPLQGSGILDSISTLLLIQFVEIQFEIEVPVSDASASNFNSVDSIAAYITAKKGEPLKP